MKSVREKIIDRLESLPDTELYQVLDFVDCLLSGGRNAEDSTWMDGDLSRLGHYEAYDWQDGEMDEGLPVSVESESGAISVDR
jgi:hypothetical protein